ncbi:LysR family transcriptional regulator [Herbaspirillum sp. ST 5-3]|uniref:LysR family transcriptional regulator n=1 Tax=Oxalobacteraceae TaxID=75682 RepID=UPI0010A49868|nr:LysR family transcriptional regulator [Herbaspirillum sp. ST 5-3]
MNRNFDGLMLGSIELFCRTAELASFTAAAVQAGVTQAAVSRSVSRLEARLGVQLFVRSTRSVRLTDKGRAYYEQCRQALGQLVEAERELTGDQVVPTGLVRMSLPTSYGHFRVLPILARFKASYPQIELEVQLSNQNVDLVADGMDLAIRARNPPDSGLIARKIEDAELVVVGSPAYLKRKGRPKSPDELGRHDCIQFERPRTGQAIPWLLRADGTEVEIETRGSLRITDDVLGLSTAARSGAGLAQTYRFIVVDDLASGRLVEVMRQFGGTSRPFSILYPAHRHMPHRVRVLIEFLLERLRPAGSPRV